MRMVGMATSQMAMYFNLAFIVSMALGALAGLWKGYKKGLYWFVVMAVYYLLFFVSIQMMTPLFWSMKIPFLGLFLGRIDRNLQSALSVQDVVHHYLLPFIQKHMGTDEALNAELLQLMDTAGQLLFKIVYTILYFTIFLFLYKAFFGLVRIMFIRTHRGEPAHRFLGILFGVGQSLLGFSVAVILSSGLMSLSRQGLVLLSEIEKQMEKPFLQENTRQRIEGAIEGYHQSLPVRFLYQWELKDHKTNVNTPLPIQLFDAAYRIRYRGEDISLRKELSLILDMVTTYYQSDVPKTKNWADFKPSEVQTIVRHAQRSDLIPLILPLGIELFYERSETGLPVSRETLYGIDWKRELQVFGEVVLLTYELIDTSGLRGGQKPRSEITLDGDHIERIFDELADSQVINESVAIIAKPLLARNERLSLIITIPDDIEMDHEIRAIGLIAKEIFNTNITLGDLESRDVTRILSVLDTMDLTVFLESRIISEALINIFTNKANIEAFSRLVVPEGIVWYDTYNETGERIQDGELRRLLVAFQKMVQVVDSIDFSTFDLRFVSRLDDSAIEHLFDSEVLVATVSTHLLNLELGTTPLVVADDLLNEQHNLHKEELKHLARATREIYDQLSCETCENGIDLNGIFAMEDAIYETIFNSRIIADTIGQLVYDQGSEFMVIPDDVKTTVYREGNPIDVVRADELQNLLLAGKAMGFQSIDNLEIHVNFLKSLKQPGTDLLDREKADRVFASKIVHATTSKLLFDASESNPALVIPRVALSGDPLIITENEAVTFIDKEELKHLLQGVLMLDIDEFEHLTDVNLQEMAEHMPILTNSAIIHASISKQILTLNPSQVYLPQTRFNGKPFSITVADGTLYVDKDEIHSLAKAAILLNIHQVNDFTGTIDLTPIFIEANQDQLLTSSLIHYHLSQQLLQNPQGFFVTPYKNEEGKDIRVVRGSDEYVSKEEIKAIIGALEVLGLNSIDGFTNRFDLQRLNTEDAQEQLLRSAIIQATLSKKLLDFDDDIIIVPLYREGALEEPVQLTITHGAGYDLYVVKDELKAIINGFLAMGYVNFESFDTMPVTSDRFFNARETLLKSASIQATISHRLLSNAMVQVPDSVRVHMPDLTYITKDELERVLDALEALQLTNFDAFDFGASIIIVQNIDYDRIVQSKILQATISKEILAVAKNEHVATDNRMLIVPSTLRELTTINGVDFEQIQQDELARLLDALRIFAVADFNVPLDAASLNAFTETEIDQLLASGSVHYTIQHMIQDNDFLVIPDYAKEPFYGLEHPIITRDEVKRFILAVQALASGDITTITFNFESIAQLNAEKQEVVLSSIIVRATISGPLRTLVNSYDPTYLQPEHYEDEATGVLTKEAILAIFDSFLY